MMLEEMQDQWAAEMRKRQEAARAEVEEIAKERGVNAMAELAAKEEHKPRLPEGAPKAPPVDPDVLARLQRVVDFVALHDGVTRAQINAHVEGVTDNTLAKLRADGKLHYRQSSNGYRTRGTYYAGPKKTGIGGDANKKYQAACNNRISGIVKAIAQKEGGE